MQRPITVLICNERTVLRDALRRRLEIDDRIDVVDETASPGETAGRVAVTRPDVVLLDVAMPGNDAIAALAAIRTAAPETGILVLSACDDPAYVLRSFQAGADGYLLRDAADSDLCQAIRLVADGSGYVDSTLGARLALLPKRTRPRRTSERAIQRSGAWRADRLPSHRLSSPSVLQREHPSPRETARVLDVSSHGLRHDRS